MSTLKILRRLAFVGGAVLIPVMPAVASANSGPTHVGPPWVWGPPLQVLCGSPSLAVAQGYNVIVLTNLNDTFTGTPMADAIYALKGNDRVDGAGGDDVLCLGPGNDIGRGNIGNDAVFGEAGTDQLFGGPGNDYLDGGAGVDACNGGAGVNALVNC